MNQYLQHDKKFKTRPVHTVRLVAGAKRCVRVFLFMPMSGWIKLHRSLLDWEWYSDINATRLLIHLLVSVNYEDKRWRGVVIKAGSMALSWDTLSEGSQLSVKQCRVAMDKLEKSGEVGRERAGNFQIVSLVKWDKMQSGEIETEKKGQGKGRERAGKGQGKGSPGATTKEREEVEEENNLRSEEGDRIVSIETQNRPKNFVKPSLEEVSEYFKEKKYDGAKYLELVMAEKFVNYYESKGWRIGKTPMKDWRAAIRTWILKEKDEQENKGAGNNGGRNQGVSYSHGGKNSNSTLRSADRKDFNTG